MAQESTPACGDIWMGRLIQETPQFPILVLSATSRADFEGLYYEETRGRLLTISGEMSQAFLVEKSGVVPDVHKSLAQALTLLNPAKATPKDLDETDILEPVSLDADSEYDRIYGRNRIDWD